jgi:FMN-dependent NADH-azoreductase
MGVFDFLFGGTEPAKRRMLKDVDNYWMNSPDEDIRVADMQSEKKKRLDTEMAAAKAKQKIGEDTKAKSKKDQPKTSIFDRILGGLQ